MKKIFLCLLAFSPAVWGSQKNIDLDVIYGEDNRSDVFASQDSALVELSRSTAAMISPSYMKKMGSRVQLGGRTLEARGVCSKERFSQQLSVASCSGFLVAPRVLVTAGHCVKGPSDCAVNKWVFDYKYENEHDTSISVPTGNVYGCRRIIERKADPSTKDDYAVIELDRSVNDRRPLKFRKHGEIQQGEKVAVIGHPTGLPTKITTEGYVRTLMKNYFVTNLDTYGGNSGSPVFNASTLEVEGVLVRGENDYVKESSGCQVSKRCEETGCRGEDVMYITQIEALQRPR